MLHLYDRYKQGFYQEVYDELLSMQEDIYEPHVYSHALSVMKMLMQRVRHNIELIIPRLHTMGYLFGETVDPPAQKAYWAKEAPIYTSPNSEILQQVTELEHLVGPLPLSIKCWYEEVGSVNFVGLFSPPQNRRLDYNYACTLDPIFIYTMNLLLKMINVYIELGSWEQEPYLPIAPDRYFKYGFSGGGQYQITQPCKAFDAPLEFEWHNTTFVNYLRICFRWGGFPGLEKECRLSQDELAYLTKDLLLF